MTNDSAIIVAISAVVGALVGSGGVYGWLKAGPERRKITIDTAQGILVMQGDVLEDIRQAYDRLCTEFGEMKMEAISREEQHANCRREIDQLQQTVRYLQRDLDRHGRMAELARRKAHVAVHAIGGYELLIDEILTEMRNHQIPIPPILRPHTLRVALQAEMDKLEKMEAAITEQAVEVGPPD